MKRRNVVISGVGLVTPLGNDTDSTWEALRNARSGIRELTSFDAAFPVRVGGQVLEFDPAPYVTDRKVLKVVMRDALFAMAAARKAIGDAALSPGDVDPVRFGLYSASSGSRGDIGDLYAAMASARRADGSIDVQRFGREGLKGIFPLWLLKSLANNGLCHLSIQYNIRGANCNYVASSVGGMQAISSGLRAIQRGDLDVVLCVGYDSFVHWEDLLSYSRVGFLARNEGAWAPERVSRPFDLKRCGAVPSEGAGAMLLESEDHARTRGARPYASVLGAAHSVNGNSLIAPPDDGQGIAQALRTAMRDAEIGAADLSCICANGSSSPRLDRSEAYAIRGVLGDAADDLPVTAPKSMLGHMMAASGVVETGVAAKMIRDSVIVPTINYEFPDPLCPLNVIDTGGPRRAMNVVACLSSGIGGQNAALVLGRH